MPRHRCRYCGADHLEGSPLPLGQWNWRGIAEAEAQCRKRASRLPRCRICRLPMMCGQASWQARDIPGALPVEAGSHWVCTLRGSVVP